MQQEDLDKTQQQCSLTVWQIAYHRQYAWACVFANKVLICKSCTIYAQTACTITLQKESGTSAEWVKQAASSEQAACEHAYLDKVTPLYHETFDDSVKSTTFVPHWLHVAPASLVGV